MYWVGIIDSIESQIWQKEGCERVVLRGCTVVPTRVELVERWQLAFALVISRDTIISVNDYY